jgi:taurine--2-oxoglutarate transaminase
VYVTDDGGKTYLDFSSQLVNTNVGHQHPAVVQAIQKQAGTLSTIAPQHGYESRYQAAELILDRSFDGAAKVFFTNGGTEAVEHAIRMARLHTGRQKVLAAYRSYHGATATSINLTGDPRRWPNDNGTSCAGEPGEHDPLRGSERLRRDHPRERAGHGGDHGATRGFLARCPRDL